jgi:hypothetical protein
VVPVVSVCQLQPVKKKAFTTIGARAVPLTEAQSGLRGSGCALETACLVSSPAAALRAAAPHESVSNADGSPTQAQPSGSVSSIDGGGGCPLGGGGGGAQFAVTGYALTDHVTAASREGENEAPAPQQEALSGVTAVELRLSSGGQALEWQDEVQVSFGDVKGKVRSAAAGGLAAPQ